VLTYWTLIKLWIKRTLSALPSLTLHAILIVRIFSAFPRWTWLLIQHELFALATHFLLLIYRDLFATLISALTGGVVSALSEWAWLSIPIG
jgi:hypothetical protein